MPDIQTFDKVYLTWDNIEELLLSLKKQIWKEDLHIDYISAIPRGGLIPGVVLSHKLEIPMLEHPDQVCSGKSVLIVDEICDSGKTLHKIAQSNKHYTIHNDVSYSYAVLLKRKSATFEPDFYGDLVEDGKYIIFPWERDVIELPKSWE